jgi:hypothetical protein
MSTADAVRHLHDDGQNSLIVSLDLIIDHEKLILEHQAKRLRGLRLLRASLMTLAEAERENPASDDAGMAGELTDRMYEDLVAPMLR